MAAMHQRRKAEGLTMNTIVIAALAVIVLFVVIWIFRDQVISAIRGYDYAKNNSGSVIKGES